MFISSHLALKRKEKGNIYDNTGSTVLKIFKRSFRDKYSSRLQTFVDIRDYAEEFPRPFDSVISFVPVDPGGSYHESQTIPRGYWIYPDGRKPRTQHTVL